jgi:chemosensory pili system protein ChpA (sensor histidine kinase/response regulator)
VVTSKSKASIDEAEALVATIRGSVLVYVQEGVQPKHLRSSLDFARLLNEQVADINDDEVLAAADALEAWLMLLVAESEPISDTRTRSLLDQISELEAALFACRAKDAVTSEDVDDLVDVSFDFLTGSSGQFPALAPVDNTGDFSDDTELLDVFNEEAQSILQSIKRNLAVLSAQPTDREALWEIKRSAHTFKGAAGVVGLRKSSDLAHRIEDLLERLSEKNADLNVHIVGLLLNAADCLESLSSDAPSHETDSKIEPLYEEFAKALGNIAAEERPAAGDTAPAGQVARAAPKRRASDHYAAPRPTSSIVRVSLDRLDELGRIVRDLFSSRSAFEQRLDELEQQLEESHNNSLRLLAVSKLDGKNSESSLARYDDEPPRRDYELAEAVKDSTLINTAFDNVKTNLTAVYDAQGSLISEIQERLLRLRHVEFGSIANRLQRTVRVTCDEEEKRAETVIENGSLEVDTQLIDSLIEPLLHLLKNAVVHGIENPETRRILGKPEVGKITIRVGNKGANIVVSVTDDGRGIAFMPLLEKAVVSNLITRAEAEEMSSDKICELIFLPGLTTAKKLNLNAGRGVGMSIVRESVVAAGGNISIETWPQKGTTFTIRIPRPFAEPAPEQPAPQNTFAAASSRIRVLIVDDSPSVRLTTSRVIEKAGWHVETAKNGIDALEKMRMFHSPNVILSDVEMPRMGGFEFVRALREDEALKNIPVIFISSRTDPADREQAAAVGAEAYLTKPYDQVQLLELINRVVLSYEQSGSSPSEIIS